MGHKFNPANLARLESADREQMLDVQGIFDALRLEAGRVLADIGSGPGFFSLRAARRVGTAGKVYAVDVQPAMVQRVREQAQAQGLSQVEALQSEENRVPLPDGAADAALVAMVLHEAEDQVAFLREVRRVVRPGGRIAIIEWNKVEMEMGPPLHERMDAQEVRSRTGAAGYPAPQPIAAGEHFHGHLHIV